MTLPGAFPDAYPDMAVAEAQPPWMTPPLTANADWTENPFLLHRHLTFRLSKRKLLLEGPYAQALINLFTRYDQRVWLLLEWAKMRPHDADDEQHNRRRPPPPAWEWLEEEWARQGLQHAPMHLDNHRSSSNTLHEDVLECLARRMFCKLVKTWAPSDDATLLAFQVGRMPMALDYYICDELDKRGNLARSQSRRRKLVVQQRTALRDRLCEFLTTCNALPLVQVYCPDAHDSAPDAADVDTSYQAYARWEQGILFDVSSPPQSSPSDVSCPPQSGPSDVSSTPRSRPSDVAGTLRKVLLIVALLLGLPMARKAD
ncbi:hypothetical protein CERZMDRAFT_101868 [Cercospora zeae-maydis SCOH1-5]|uniref:Uncharacterized protein n=1 Tax=Cercospora zeae-maydis SCOH1-5 TaxID=717836 RepID=A0A6A6F2J9_9PEZI|nr:hypothetical protein CERZMDRAFT_101868 [Cercospora zeae-maydis SCOH1-5]